MADAFRQTGTAGPFLKWAGGKGQLLPQLAARLPAALRAGRLERYVEPFVGSGALFFYVRQRYAVGEYVLIDRNPALIQVYQAVQSHVDALIERLLDWQARYRALDEAGRRTLYYAVRTAFNAHLAEGDESRLPTALIEQAARFIFLNRTCYNGLFRVNRQGAFNVPFGRYRNPTICQSDNLRAAARCLAGVRLTQGDFTTCRAYVDAGAFVYFDPPYRPLGPTANFTAYATDAFDEAQQRRLASLYRDLAQGNAYLMLSNSDPVGLGSADPFYAAAYAGFHVEKVQARRRINSRADGRGAIDEVLILNYAPDVAEM